VLGLVITDSSIVKTEDLLNSQNHLALSLTYKSVEQRSKAKKKKLTDLKRQASGLRGEVSISADEVLQLKKKERADTMKINEIKQTNSYFALELRQLTQGAMFCKQGIGRDSQKERKQASLIRQSTPGWLVRS